MRLVGVTALLAVVLLAAGCGGPPEPPPRVPTDAPPGGTSTPPVPPDPLVADPPPGGTALDPARVNATALPPGFPVLVWAAAPRTIGVYGRAGGCTEASAEVITETAQEITVRVVQTATAPEPCTRELRYPPLELPLAADLGERRVVLTGDIR